MTEDEAYERAVADYRAVEGREILVRQLAGYVGDDQLDLDLNPPVLVKVDGGLVEAGAIDHWVNEWLDPYWDCTPVGGDPRLPAEGLSGAWSYGVSYRVPDGKREGWFRLPTPQELGMFLRPLAEDPGDKATRLVYADWLQESGLVLEANGQRRMARRWGR